VILLACASPSIAKRKNGVQFNQAAAKEIKEARTWAAYSVCPQAGLFFSSSHHPPES
jgi:hypothetical protein